MIEAIRHVREQNTGGLEYRRYVFKQAFCLSEHGRSKYEQFKTHIS